MQRWTLGNIIGLIALVVAIIGLAVSVAVPEARQLLGLEETEKSSSEQVMETQQPGVSLPTEASAPDPQSASEMEETEADDDSQSPAEDGTVMSDGQAAEISIDTLDKLVELTNVDVSGDAFAIGVTDMPGIHRLAIGTGKDIQIWDFGPEIDFKCAISNSDIVTSLDISTGGSWLASGSQDGSIQVWDLDNCSTSSNFAYTGTSPVNNVSFRRNEDLLAVSSTEGFGRVYTLNGGTLQDPRILDLGSDASPVLHSPDGELLGIMDSKSTSFSLIDYVTGEYAGTVSEDPLYYTTQAFSNDSEFVAVGHGDFLELISVRQIVSDENYEAEKVWVTPFAGDWNSEIAFTPTDELLAGIVGSELIWHRVDNGKLLDSKNIGPFGWKWMSFSADGLYLVLAADSGVEIWGIPSP